MIGVFLIVGLSLSSLFVNMEKRLQDRRVIEQIKHEQPVEIEPSKRLEMLKHAAWAEMIDECGE